MPVMVVPPFKFWLLQMSDYAHVQYAQHGLHKLVFHGWIFAFFSLLSILGFSRFIGKKKCISRPWGPHSALLAFLTPTFSPWPKNYIALMPHSTCAQSRIIRVQIFLLLAKICDGDVELRDDLDLADIFRHRFQARGWFIHLSVNLTLWLSVAKWICVSRIPTLTHTNNITACPVDDASTLAYGQLDSNNISGPVYLDFIPYSDLEHVLCAVKASLKPGSFISFEFTTVSPDIPFLSDSFVFCSLPFMPQRYFKPDGLPRRTSTPLLISLHRVIELLTSAACPLFIETIKNVTSEHVAAFGALHDALAKDRTLRSGSVQKWGEKGWKEHRFMIAWERALLTAGYLTKWIVVARK